MTNVEIDKEIRLLEDNKLVLETENGKISKRLLEYEKENENLFKLMGNSVKSVEFIESVALNEREAIKKKIEGMISEILGGVYGKEYAIEFEYGIKNNRTSVEVYTVKDLGTHKVKRTIEGSGGGVADAISLPLKLLVLLSSPNVSRVLIADEPGKHMDVVRFKSFVELLRVFSDRLSVQVIMSTHHVGLMEELVNYADRVNLVEIEEGKSRVTKVK